MLTFLCLLFVLCAGPHSLIDSPRDLGEAHWDQQVQGVSKKSGISKCLTFCLIVLVLMSSQKNNLSFHKIEFIAVILSI